MFKPLMYSSKLPPDAEQTAQHHHEDVFSFGFCLLFICRDKEARFFRGLGEPRRIAASMSRRARVFSPEAPLGKALMGHKAGETVSYKAPNGRVLQAEIKSVQQL